MKISDDLAVVAYGNTPWCQILQPSLTSLDFQIEKIARLAVDTLFKEKNTDYEKVLVEPKLIIRDSCGGKKPQNVNSGLTNNIENHYIDEKLLEII